MKPCVQHIDKQRVRGHRSRGRARKKWTDVIRETFANYGVIVTEVTHLAQKWQLYLPSTLHYKRKDNLKVK